MAICRQSDIATDQYQLLSGLKRGGVKTQIGFMEGVNSCCTGVFFKNTAYFLITVYKGADNFVLILAAEYEQM